MFCKKCGKEIKDTDKYCPYCGAPVDEELDQYRIYGQPERQYSPQQINKDSGSFWWGMLGLISPLIGFILFFVYRKSRPKTAKVLLFGSIIGLIINILTNLLMLKMGGFGDIIEGPNLDPNPGIPDSPNHGGNF